MLNLEWVFFLLSLSDCEVKIITALVVVFLCVCFFHEKNRCSKREYVFYWELYNERVAKPGFGPTPCSFCSGCPDLTYRGLIQIRLSLRAVFMESKLPKKQCMQSSTSASRLSRQRERGPEVLPRWPALWGGSGVESISLYSKSSHLSFFIFLQKTTKSNFIKGAFMVHAVTCVCHAPVLS